MEATMEEGDCLSQEEESAWNDDLDVSQLCRICANPNEYLIPIFEGEGLEHELETKIVKHLPIKVTYSDELPTNLCYQCASTLIAWHDMVVGCVEADEKLRSAAHYKTGNNIKVIDRMVAKETPGGNNCESQNKIIPFTRINHTAYVSQEQDPKLITSAETEQVAVEEEITSVKHEIMEDETPGARCLGTFNAYHQTQVALRMLQWANRGSMFCVICGKMRENQTLLIKHLYIEHKIQCGHCDARFTNEQELASHMLNHGNENYLTRRTLSNRNRVNLTNEKKHHIRSRSCLNEDKRDCDAPLFVCEICSVSFLRRFDLKKHKIKYHSNENSDSNKENGVSMHTCVSKVNSSEPEKEGNSLVKQNKSLREDETCCLSNSDDFDKEESTDDLFVKPEVRLFEAKYFCTLCDFSCNAKCDLTFHKQSVHSLENRKKTISKEKKPQQCEICKNTYSRKADLQRHIHKIHTSEEFSVRKRDSVDDMNVDIISLAKESINGIIVYRCGVCGKNLRTKKGFVRHVRVHTGERPFTCHVCGKQYRSNTDLSRHLKCVHEGIKKYQCDICGRSFANKATKNDHRRTHTGEKPFMCDVCGKSFPTPNSIYIHRRIHTNYFPHECKTCDKKFRRKQQLIHHTRTHTGEKPHACNVCGKCFAVKDEVTRHKLTHSNEKPHTCPACGFAFAQKRYLTNHIKTHHSGMM